LGIGPQSPIPNPQSPIPNLIYKIIKFYFQRVARTIFDKIKNKNLIILFNPLKYFLIFKFFLI